MPVRQIFKPLRNYLAQLDQLSFLSAIYYLSTHVEFGLPLPEYLKAANPTNSRDWTKLNFYMWELDTLAREVFIHSPHYGGKPVHWKHVANSLNLLKWTENEAYGAHGDENSVFSEMARIAHRQFHWQQGVSHPDITRYRRIYRQSGMDEVVQQEFGLTAEQYFLAGFALLATFMKHSAFADPFLARVEQVLGFSAAPLVERYTTTIPQLRNEGLGLRSLDVDWAYTFHPLWAHPLIELAGGRTICPIPGLLARRFTDGLYFDFAKNPDNLARHLGPAFQTYIGDVLNAANRGRFRITPEASFGKPKAPKRSVDWIVEDETGVLFIECKVLRLAYVGRSKLAPIEPIDREFRKLARAVAQTYASLEIALRGEYPHWKPSEKPVYPMIVTMDNWNLFTHITMGMLREMVTEELNRRGVDLTLVDRHPYTTCWARELEMGIQVMHELGIDGVLRGITRDKLGYLFSGYLQSEFSDAVQRTRPLFPDEPEGMLALLHP